MKEGINDWGLNYNILQTKSLSKTRLTNREDFSVRLCPICKNAYEQKRNDYKKVIIAEYHESFPTIGLKRRICINCEEKEMCELCGSEEGIRRDDNIHVCNECDDKYPVREPDEEENG